MLVKRAPQEWRPQQACKVFGCGTNHWCGNNHVPRSSVKPTCQATLWLFILSAHLPASKDCLVVVGQHCVVCKVVGGATGLCGVPQPIVKGLEACCREHLCGKHVSNSVSGLCDPLEWSVCVCKMRKHTAGVHTLTGCAGVCSLFMLGPVKMPAA